MPGRTYSNGNSYRYGFNGKENDNEIKGEGNQQDYGMRIYDPRLGRFLSVDPLEKEYPELTPYQFSSNRPIDGIDRDGLEWELSTVKHNLETRAKLDNQVALNSRSTIGPATKSNPPASVRIHNYYTNPTIKKFVLHPGYAGGYLLYNVFNDGKIVGSSFINGGRNATDMIGNRTNEKQRVGAFVNVATTVGAPLLEAEITTTKIASAEAQLLRNEAEGFISQELRLQKQVNEHTLGGKSLEGNSYLYSKSDAEDVLNALHSGKGEVIYANKSQNEIIFDYSGVKGVYKNPAKGIEIESSRFIIKGNKSATVVPTDPSKTFKK